MLSFLLPASADAQDTTKSLAFKKNRPYKNSPYFYQPDLSYQLIHQFKLLQIANSGDPLAQHELGLRLLTGEGIAPDTITAVYWMKKAARQKLSAAQYNYGIMLLNGWGTDWNPFEAFDNFLEAAESGMSQAQYVVGILYTDNLIVRRDWNKSYYWIKKSFNSGFKPAKEILEEISPKVSKAFIDSVSADKFAIAKEKPPTEKEATNIQSSLGLVFIDFSEDQDSTEEIPDNDLLMDLERTEIKGILDSLGIKIRDSSLTVINSEKQIRALRKLAESGSPEAQVILGRLYQEGIYVENNIISSAEYYIRAATLDSHRAAFLLWKLVKERNFLEILQDALRFNDPVAQYVWFGLTKLGYFDQLNGTDAMNLLMKSADQNHLPALVELGYSYYTGKYLPVDKIQGLKIWTAAKNFGSTEAEERILASEIFDSNSGETDKKVLNRLISYSDNGSVLAQVALAYCYENSIGTTKNLALASKFYRTAAQRGNSYAYEQLKRIYDDLRPISEKYRISTE